MSDEGTAGGSVYRHKRAIIGAVTAVTSVVLSYFALDAQPQFTGTNAVTFSAIGIAGGLLIHYGDKIESIKSKYFEVKLKAAAEEAEKTVAETKRILQDIRDTRRSMFRSAIQSITYSNNPTPILFGDFRIDRLVKLVEDIKHQDSYEDLRQEIESGALRLLDAQHQLARENTNLYGEADSQSWFIAHFSAEELLERAKAEKQRREVERVDDDTTGLVLDTLIRDLPKLIEILDEARKSPSE